MDKINIVKEWFGFAEKDIASAKFLLDMRPVPLEIVCYHCEQAAEKALKSYLIYKDSEPLRTHDLKLLCKICSDMDQSFIEISQCCINLTPYGVQPRYPFEIEINDNDMQKAIADADQVLIFIQKKLTDAKMIS
jgi:HEPN domain-containing protein